MATYQLAVYSPTDASFVHTGGGNYDVIINPGAVPTIITITDTDTGANETIFNDGDPAVDGGAGWAVPNQTFSGTIDGTVYSGQTINPEWEFDVDSGEGSVFGLYPGDGGTNIGLGFTFQPVPGTTYTFSTSGSGTLLPNIQDTELFVCFTKGTEIETISGPQLIEDLVIGDEIWTEKNGFQPLRWIGSKRVDVTRESCPIRFKAGTLGATRDLLVSQQHRMLIKSPDLDIMFGQPKMLSAAKHLVNGKSIDYDLSSPSVEYFHLLFEQHEIINANGVLSESFYPGGEAMNTLEAPQRMEVLSLFPELEQFCNTAPVVYPVLKSFEARSISC